MSEPVVVRDALALMGRLREGYVPTEEEARQWRRDLEAAGREARWAPVFPPVLATAPETLEGWTRYAPHRQDAAGQWMDEQQDRLLDLARTWDADWRAVRKDAPWLILLGDYGTGKTLLARILGRRAAEAGLRVRWSLFRDAIQRVKQTRSPQSGEREQDVIEYLAGWPDLLVLDDVRPVFRSDDDENIADLLIRYRYGVDLGRPRRGLILTANVSVADLGAVLGGAALNRALERPTRLIVCDWPSWRTLHRDLDPREERESYP